MLKQSSPTSPRSSELLGATQGPQLLRKPGLRNARLRLLQPVRLACGSYSGAPLTQIAMPQHGTILRKCRQLGMLAK